MCSPFRQLSVFMFVVFSGCVAANAGDGAPTTGRDARVVIAQYQDDPSDGVSACSCPEIECGGAVQGECSTSCGDNERARCWCATCTTNSDGTKNFYGTTNSCKCET